MSNKTQALSSTNIVTNERSSSRAPFLLAHDNSGASYLFKGTYYTFEDFILNAQLIYIGA